MALSSAFAQESVSKVSSYISSRLDDVASRGNLFMRLEMAILRMEFAIERSGKLPITDVSLLRRRNLIRGACIEGKELLRQQQRLEEVGQVVASSSSFLGRVTRAASRSVLSMIGFDKGYLSSSSVQKFEQFAEWADKLLQDVKTGCSLRRYMTSNNPFARPLFEWKTLLGCRTKQEGTLLQSAFIVWTTRSEERGVEASLAYMYDDPEIPEQSFDLTLGLRLSESTDIIGTAIKCLQPLVPQFKVAAEFAIGELSQQASTATSKLLKLSPSMVDSLVPLKKNFAYVGHRARLDPICCWSNERGPSGDNPPSSSELSHICPEEVTFLQFNFHVVLEKKYGLRRTPVEVDRRNRSVMLRLEVEVTFMPHFDLEGMFPQLVGLEGSASIEFGSNHNCRLIGIQEVLDTVGTAAMQSYLHRPQLTRYRIFWFSNKHGAAIFDVRKPTTRRSRAKRKRARCLS